MSKKTTTATKPAQTKVATAVFAGLKELGFAKPQDAFDAYADSKPDADCRHFADAHAEISAAAPGDAFAVPIAERNDCGVRSAATAGRFGSTSRRYAAVIRSR